MSLSRTGLATVVALVAASLSLEAGEVESVPRIVLVAAGKPTASIVVAKKAPAVERHAARELRKYVQRMTGAELPVRTGSRGDGPSIYIGSAAPVRELDLSKSALGEDGYVVKTVGGNIVLTGARPYSCLYAVYHLLENYLGCGFFEDGDHVPRQASVAVPALNDVEKPFYKYRRFLMAGLEMYGTRWWNLEEWRRHLDWGAKKRFNVLDQQENFLEGHVKLNIWRRLGVEIESTDWQKGQIALRKKVFEYARMLGMKIQYSCNFLETPGSHKPGGTARPQVWQWDQFIDRSPNPVPTLTNSHHGEPFPVIDPRTDFARKVIHIGVEELIKMFGTDHLYSIRQPSEDSYVGLSEKEQREVIWSMMVDMRKVIREVDPEARVEGGWYWEFSPTHVIEAQHTAIREALKMGFTYIMCPGIEPGRYRQERSYLKGNVFEGAPWWTGVIGMGAGTVNFFGDLAGTIRELQIMVNNPTAAANLEGYMVWPEALRRNIMAVDLYMRLGWEDPRTVTLEGFLRRYADARYGKKAGYLLVPALRHLTDSVYAFNSNRCGNIPLYRMLGAAGEVVELNNRNLIRFMPDTWKALRIMATQQVLLADDPLYRFDMVEVGRNYLGQEITDYVIKARAGVREKGSGVAADLDKAGERGIGLSGQTDVCSSLVPAQDGGGLGRPMAGDVSRRV